MPSLSGVRRRVAEIVDPAKPGDILSRVFDVTIVSLILVSIGVTIAQSEAPLAERYGTLFGWLEWVTVGVFTVEYLARLWSATARPAYPGAVVGRLRFACRPFMVIDLIAVAPAYIALFGVDASALIVLRSLRILRILKIARYSESMTLFAEVIRARSGELMITGLVAALLLLFASTGMYLVEGAAQPGAFGSIPRAMWWGVVTLTTVGYGDVYPVTGLGRLFGAVIAIVGIGVVAAPTGILAAGFSEALAKRRRVE